MNKIEYYPSLDGIRAYAALGIILMHVLANIALKPSNNYLTETIIPFFTDFTLLFMIVSAFSMSCGYYQRVKEGDITPNVFYKKRYNRILPFFAILCFIDLLWEFNIDTLYQVYANLTLCFGLLPSYNITVIGVGWFLGIVFIFYLLFPFFVYLLDNKHKAWIVFIVIIVFVLIAKNGEFVNGLMNKKNIIFCAPYFFSGGIIYLYRNSIVKIVTKYKLLLGIFVILFTIFYFAFRSEYSWEYEYLIKLCLFSLWIVYAIGAKTVLLSNRILKYLSNISMEIYLSHMLIFRFVQILHLEDYISDNNILYILTSFFTIIGVVCFAHVMKYFVIRRLEKMLRIY